MREHSKDRLLNPIEELYAARRVSQQEFSDIWNKLPSAPVLKHVTQVPNDPVQGMFVVDPTRPDLPGWCFYLGDTWYCVYPRPPVHAIKVYSDTRLNQVRDGAFKFTIGKDLDNHVISFVEGGNGTEGVGSTVLQISNRTRGLDILSTPCTIASGAFHDNGTTVINEGGDPANPVNLCHWKDRMWIDVDAVGTGSKGAYIYITFTPFENV